MNVAGRIIAGAVGHDLSAAATQSIETRAGQVLSRDSVVGMMSGVSAPVNGLVQLARSVSSTGDRAATELAFRSAGRLAYARPMAGLPELDEAIRVAAIARQTPQADGAVGAILRDAKARFNSYDARSRLADAARRLGQHDLHVELMAGRANYAPGVAEHVRLAGELSELAKTDPAYKPLVDRTLRRANDRVVQVGETDAVLQAARTQGDHGAYLEALAIKETLRTLGQAGPGAFRPSVQGVLGALRAPGARPYLPLDSVIRRGQRVLRTLVQRLFAAQISSNN